MSNMSIPSFGAVNGVAGNPITSQLDPALNTIVAVMYNYYDPALISDNSAGLVTNSSNRLALNPYGISPIVYTDMINNDKVKPDYSITKAMPLSLFLSLFYPTNAGYFNVNQTNSNNPAIILSRQSYTSTNNPFTKFSLVQYLLKAYCTNKGINVNDLDHRITLLLQKEAFAAQSLASIKGTTISMSWDEVVNTLLRSGVIEPLSYAAHEALVNAYNSALTAYKNAGVTLASAENALHDAIVALNMLVSADNTLLATYRSELASLQSQLNDIDTVIPANSVGPYGQGSLNLSKLQDIAKNLSAAIVLKFEIAVKIIQIDILYNQAAYAESMGSAAITNKRNAVTNALATLETTELALETSRVALNTGAIVPLSVMLNYHSFVLDTDLSISFTYLVNILGYVLPSDSPAK